MTSGMRTRVLATAIALSLVPAVAAGASALPEAPACPLFPADSIWHTDVSAAPVHPQSAAWIATGGASTGWHADFGSGLWDGGPIGIPYTTVSSAQHKVPMSFDYDDESDPGPYPFPPNAKIEGGAQSSGDRHVLVVDRDACRLYETWSSYPQGDGSWQAGSGAVWDLRSHALRPAGWTSADAAGLPILPGLVRYDEVAAGHIDHAIRFTLPRTARSYVWPARHQAGESTDPALPPMGARFRLKAGVDIAGFPPRVQTILRAAKTYGLVLADNGSAWYLSGVPDERWDNDELHAMDVLRGADLEAVDVSGLMVHPDSGQARSSTCRPTPAATLSMRTAYPRVRVGQTNYFGGYLLGGGCPVVGDPVGLFVRTRPGPYHWVATSTTNGRGQWQLILRMPGSYDVLAIHSSSARTGRAVAGPVHVTVVR